MGDTTRHSCWSLTINNPTADDEECIALARQKGWRVEGQLERGSEGTPHYQLKLSTGQVRFSAVKKAFPRAHIEPARNVSALTQYVTKEDTRIGTLSTTQEKYPSLSRFWQLVYDRMSDEEGGPADEIDWTRVSDKRKLERFDSACYTLITEGYHIETMAVNPQVRACFAKFAGAILFRAFADRQTDRQPSTENVAVVNIPTHDGRSEFLRSEGEARSGQEEEPQAADHARGGGRSEGDCEG